MVHEFIQMQRIYMILFNVNVVLVFRSAPAKIQDGDASVRDVDQSMSLLELE
jgi:hypothetical protein